MVNGNGNGRTMTDRTKCELQTLNKLVLFPYVIYKNIRNWFTHRKTIKRCNIP